MKNKKRIFHLLLAVGLGVSSGYAQEAVTPSGGEATGTGGTASYSVGQIAYTTNTGANGSLAQGVQQAYVILNVGIQETNLTISLIAFPNPTTDNLTLQINDYNKQKLSYQLFDIQGKILSNGQVTAQQTQINTASLPAATYYLNIVNQENKQIESFKIIKN